MLADVMTKDKNSKKDQGEELVKLLKENKFEFARNQDNMVIYRRDEIMLLNPKEKIKVIKGDWLDENLVETVFHQILEKLKEASE